MQTLVTFYDAESERVRFHATPIELIRTQAAATGTRRLLGLGTAWPEMEARLVEVLAQLRAEGCTGVVLGDIHLADVRAWYEDRVIAAGLEHVEPLWGDAPAQLLDEYAGAPLGVVYSPARLAVLDALGLGPSPERRERL